ncbi:hypothetical protein [Hymenobacter sp. DG25A]|uniref:hypothetical protein n=1 Tax=Hymenobacter sp. DG25A TaxID=1385663 RepID=UPI0006BE1086|nr:hypothetical protein [Hymenobacter sp. DG25A]ALD21549.1 hypothetical protein AM218_10435 [Hymenobacter sp. DG25A]
MDLKDLFLTPLYLGIFYAIAYAVRPKFTNVYTKKYFIPALTVKFIGAIGLGVIYQFYYKGGDTFNYYNQAKVIYEAFDKSFDIGLKLLMHSSSEAIITYTNRIYWYNSSTEYFVIQLAGFFSLLCFNTYTIIAIFFAALSFTGMWAMYITFSSLYPGIYNKFSLPVFFLPSVFFWGSGLMKDSLCIGALGWIFYAINHIFILKNKIITSSVFGLIAIYILTATKVYILLSFIPAALFWVFIENNKRIKSATTRNLLKPIFIITGAFAAYLIAINITAGDERFDVDKIGERTKITKDYLSTYVISGSAYDIGTLDGSLGSILRVSPQAIFISLFRPFIFEAKNPVMVLSSLEAFLFLYLTIALFYKTGILKGFKLIVSEPVILFCFLFSIIFAIGVGTNSGNFGTLVRYKIPLMPFYLSALYIMQYKSVPISETRKQAQI